MAQSLNKTVELHTTGVSYMAIGGKVGKFLIGDVALEFYPESLEAKRNLLLSVNTSKWRLILFPDTFAPI